MLMEKAAAEGREQGLDEEQVLEHVNAAYQSLVAEYGQQLGIAPGADAICGWEVGDLFLLGRCKQWLQRTDPRVYWGDWMQLNQRLYGVLMRCKRTGLEPGVNERQVRWERAQHPNVLYPGLRKGEPARWGGYLDDVNGRPDQGQRVWGGARNAEEMAAAIGRWAAERSREKGIESDERGGWRLLP
jgi:hypothetical protein